MASLHEIILSFLDSKGYPVELTPIQQITDKAKMAGTIFVDPERIISAVPIGIEPGKMWVVEKETALAFWAKDPYEASKKAKELILVLNELQYLHGFRMEFSYTIGYDPKVKGSVVVLTVKTKAEGVDEL